MEARLVLLKGFYNSILLDNDDIREYSFTDRSRAEYMKKYISHLEQRIIKKLKRSANVLCH